MPADHALVARFLRPAHALDAENASAWPTSGVAETPGEDARCRVFLAVDDDDRLRAAFAAFGPPEVIACADWVCERVTGETVEFACRLAASDVEKALSLAPTQRYAGVVVIDALTHATVNLR